MQRDKPLPQFHHPRVPIRWSSIDETSSKAPFGRASGAASRAAPGEALPNGSFVTCFTCEADPEAIGGLHR